LLEKNLFPNPKLLAVDVLLILAPRAFQKSKNKKDKKRKKAILSNLNMIKIECFCA